MTSKMTEEEILELAQKRVKSRRDFYGNLGAWAVVNIILIIVWTLSGRGYMWFLWPLCIWGAFVLLHFLQVFVIKPKSDKTAVDKEVEKIKREQGE